MELKLSLISFCVSHRDSACSPFLVYYSKFAMPVQALGISIAISYCSCCHHHTGAHAAAVARRQHAAAAEHAKKGNPHSVRDAVDPVA